MIGLVDQSWFLLSVGNVLTICQESSRSTFTLWGSFGGDITPLFSNSAAPVTIRISTALTEDKDPSTNKRAYRAGVSHILGSSNPMATFTLESENFATATTYMFTKVIQFASKFGLLTFTNSLGQAINFTTGGYLFQPLQVAGTGIYLGCTLTGTFTGITLTGIVIEYAPDVPMRSKNV
jgi:hypothetical protein